MFQKISVIDEFMHDRGVTTFCRKFFVSQCRKNSWASLQCSRKFEISKKFLHNRGYQTFLSKYFCLTLPKNFVNETHWFWENFSFRKVFTDEKVGVSYYSLEKLWSHRAEKFRELPCNVLQKLWCRKNLCIIGVITFSVKNFRSHSAEKIRGHPFNVSESLG